MRNLDELAQKATDVMAKVRKELDVKKRRNLDNSELIDQVDHHLAKIKCSNDGCSGFDKELRDLKLKALKLESYYFAIEEKLLAKAKNEIMKLCHAKYENERSKLEEEIETLEERAELSSFLQFDDDDYGASMEYSNEDIKYQYQLHALKEKKADLEIASRFKTELDIMKAENQIMNKLFPAYDKERSKLGDELIAWRKKCNIECFDIQTVSREPEELPDIQDECRSDFRKKTNRSSIQASACIDDESCVGGVANQGFSIQANRTKTSRKRKSRGAMMECRRYTQAQSRNRVWSKE